MVFNHNDKWLKIIISRYILQARKTNGQPQYIYTAENRNNPAMKIPKGI